MPACTQAQGRQKMNFRRHDSKIFIHLAGTVHSVHRCASKFEAFAVLVFSVVGTLFPPTVAVKRSLCSLKMASQPQDMRGVQKLQLLSPMQFLYVKRKLSHHWLVLAVWAQASLVHYNLLGPILLICSWAIFLK